ncbi:MAG TPA: phenylalanine--tRNA ligase beta subunit-related protein, partial [Streptosporangiaceae bacterium]|nr:phenylalanine--tRNA ligase beta subunit-related protein [Streptosporangiaceae bacterium]
FPELAAGVVLAAGITGDADVTERVARLWARAGRRLAGGSEAELPEIQAWRRAFARMGLKPTQYRCASESLLRRFKKEGSLPSIHPLVDLCNALSMAYAIPVAVLDADQVDWPLQVRYAGGTESYQAFSGETEQPRPGEVVFADAGGNAHARRWTNRQSAGSAVRPGTSTVLIVAEAMHESAPADVARLIEEISAEVAATWPAAELRPALLSPEQPRFDAVPANQPAAASGYTFGDTDVAARRLRVLSEVFAPASRALLAEVAEVAGRPPALAYDLGCGPGYTTAMVSEVTAAGRTVGLDGSGTHIERARATVPELTAGERGGGERGGGERGGGERGGGAVEFGRWDVRELPFPAGPADLIYCRLLLAHLPQPAATAASWATQLTGDGLLVLDEIEWIRADDPVLRAHLRLAEAMVATGGARMSAGPLLGGLAAAGLRRRLGQVAELPVPTARAATMFSMNLTAWGDKPVELGLCDRAELADLKAGMAEALESTAEGQITWGMHQAAYGRADAEAGAGAVLRMADKASRAAGTSR